MKTQSEAYNKFLEKLNASHIILEEQKIIPLGGYEKPNMKNLKILKDTNTLLNSLKKF